MKEVLIIARSKIMDEIGRLHMLQTQLKSRTNIFNCSYVTEKCKIINTAILEANHTLFLNDFNKMMSMVMEMRGIVDERLN